MSETKFKIGDRVRLQYGVVDYIGTIAEIGIEQTSGELIYRVDFRNFGINAYMWTDAENLSLLNIAAENKYDAEKPCISDVPLKIIEDIATVRKHGIEKYKTKDGWQDVEPERYWNALMRHMMAMQNEKGHVNMSAIDPDSGLLHLSHVACNAAFMCALIERESKEESAK